MKAIYYYLKKPVTESLSTYWELLKIMAPVMLFVRLAQEFGLIELINHIFVPFMSVVGLPAEAGLIWTTTMLVNIYGGIAVLLTLLGDLDFSTAQMTVLGIMMLMAHSLPIEQRVVQKSGPSLIFTTALRIGSALLFAVLLHWLFSTFDLLAEPANIDWLPEISATSGWLEWSIDSFHTLFVIYWIILGLMIFLQVLESTGITNLISKTLAPVLGGLGISQTATPLTMIGVILGLGFGGALIMREAKNGSMKPKDIFLSLSFICLCHGMIEDTLLVLALGADLTTILIGRFIFSFLAIYLLARLIFKLPDAVFFKYFFMMKYVESRKNESSKL